MAKGLGYRATVLLVCMGLLPLVVGCTRHVTGGVASQQLVMPAPAPEPQPPLPIAAAPVTPPPVAPPEVPRAEAAPLPAAPAPIEAHKPEMIPVPPVTAPATGPEERVSELIPPTPMPSALPPAEPPAPAPAPATKILSDVYFDYDQFALRAETLAALANDARLLQDGLTGPIVIEGHCDERGTHAYNMVLGERRAQAVQRYLKDLGISSDRLQIVSYGKERPFCKEHSEACWQENRRAHFSPR